MAVSALETLNLGTFLDEHIDITDAYLARGLHVDKIQNKIGEIITQVNLNLVDIDVIEAYDPSTITPVKSIVTTLTNTGGIVGTSAGDIGHSAGAILVAAPGADYALEFISAILIYDYDTATYTAGGDDNQIENGDGGVALSAVILGADLLEAGGDKIVQINALAATDQALVTNKAISLTGTALTQPGSAAGVLRCHVSYRIHTLGLA